MLAAIARDATCLPRIAQSSPRLLNRSKAILDEARLDVEAGRVVKQEILVGGDDRAVHRKLDHRPAIG
jgi:hypothetical protein